MAVIAANPHALAIIDVLEAAGLTVGDGIAETTGTGPDARIVTPQVVVHMTPGGVVDGTLAAPDDWADARFQLTAVGLTSASVRVVSDRAAEALEGGVSVDGRSIQRVRPMEPWGRTERDHDVTPPMFYATRSFGLFTFPADDGS